MARKQERFPVLHYDTVLRSSDVLADRLGTARRVWAGDDIQEHLENPEFRFCLMDACRNHGDPPSLSVCVEAMFWYEMFGQQNYVVGPRLQEMFINTSLKGIPKEDFKLPYKSFYVVVENCEAQIWGGPRTQWHQLAGFYVTQHDDGRIFVYMWGKPNSRSFSDEDNATGWMRFDLDEIYGSFDDIEAYIEDSVTKGKSEDDLPEFTTPDTEIKKSVESYMITARIAFNLIMYLQSPNREVETETPEQRKKEFLRKYGRKKNLSKGRAGLARRDLERAGKATVTWIGRSVEEIERPRGSGSQPQMRHWVVGHWQRYWVGSGPNRRREWRHKLAFERNIAAAVAVERRYYKSVEDKPDEPDDS